MLHRMNWTPDCFGEAYEGHLVVQRLKNHERLALLARLGMADEVSQQDIKNSNTANQANYIIKAYEMARDQLVLGCSVKRVRDGKEMSMEDMEFEAELNDLVSEIASLLTRGVQPGNGSEPQSEQSS